MSSETETHTPASVKLLDRAVIVLNAIGSLWVLFLVLIICMDSFGRSFFNRPFDGVNELVAVSMAFIVFCQLPDTVRLGKLRAQRCRETPAEAAGMGLLEPGAMLGSFQRAQLRAEFGEHRGFFLAQSLAETLADPGLGGRRAVTFRRAGGKRFAPVPDSW